MSTVPAEIAAECERDGTAAGERHAATARAWNAACAQAADAAATSA
ncbi:hypothetical protein [Streptomyces sp. NPDC096105]